MQPIDERHVVADYVRKRRQQVAGLHHHVDRLVGVAEHRDAGVARHGLLAALELARLAVGLERRDDLFWHLLEVSDLVEAHDVPDHHHALLPTAHVAEQVGHGGRPGEQRGIRRQLLHRVTFAGATWPQLDQIVVPFAEWDESGQEQQLQPPLHIHWLVSHAADHEIEPLVAGEIGAESAVFVEIERGELDGYELVDPKRILAPSVLVIFKAHVYLRPDATRQ